MSRTRELLVFGLLLLCVCGSSAWFHSGHMAVGFRAWNRLSQDNKARVNRLLKVYETDENFSSGEEFLRTEFGSDAALARFLYATTWMDDVKEGVRAESDGDVTMPYFPVRVTGDPMNMNDVKFVITELPPPESSRRRGNHEMDMWHFNMADYPVTHPSRQREAQPKLREARLFYGIAHLASCIQKSRMCPQLWKENGVERLRVNDLPLIKSICLRLLLHMVGDMFMPLHLMSREYNYGGLSGRDRGGTQSCTGNGLPFTTSVIDRDGEVATGETKSLLNLHLTLDATAGYLPYTEFDQKRLSVRQTKTIMGIFEKLLGQGHMSCPSNDADSGHLLDNRMFLKVQDSAKQSIDKIFWNNLRVVPPPRGQRPRCIANLVPLFRSSAPGPDLPTKQAEIEKIFQNISKKAICNGGEYLGMLLEKIIGQMIDADAIPAAKERVVPEETADDSGEDDGVGDETDGSVDAISGEGHGVDGSASEDKEEKIIDRLESESPAPPPYSAHEGGSDDSSPPGSDTENLGPPPPYSADGNSDGATGQDVEDVSVVGSRELPSADDSGSGNLGSVDDQEVNSPFSMFPEEPEETVEKFDSSPPILPEGGLIKPVTKSRKDISDELRRIADEIRVENGEEVALHPPTSPIQAKSTMSSLQKAVNDESANLGRALRGADTMSELQKAAKREDEMSGSESPSLRDAGDERDKLAAVGGLDVKGRDEVLHPLVQVARKMRDEDPMLRAGDGA